MPGDSPQVEAEMWSAFNAVCTRWDLQVSRVRFLFGEPGLLISASDTPDRVGLMDGDVLVAQVVFEE